MLAKTYILGVGITTASEEKILELIDAELRKPLKDREKIVVFTPNPEQLSSASRHKQLQDMLNQADIALPDGAGVVVAAKLLGKPLYTRITGVDFIQNMLGFVSKQAVNTGYLGSQPGVAIEAANCLKRKHPKILIGYASEVYNKEKMIHSDIDILFVALGFPKQEEWILAHKDEVPATIIVAVGGSFDFISGRTKRAPDIIQKIGLEWLFRLIMQPWRFWRQLQIWHFGALILLEALVIRLRKASK